jgi:hypothetical protein
MIAESYLFVEISPEADCLYTVGMDLINSCIITLVIMAESYLIVETSPEADCW